FYFTDTPTTTIYTLSLHDALPIYALAERMSLMADPFGQGNNNKTVVPLNEYDIWLQPGDVTKYPYPYAYTRSEAIRPFRYDQTLWAESGSYFKVSNIILSYSF